MSTTENTATGSSRFQYPEQKDNRKVIYGILIALLIGTWAYIFYDKSKSKESIAQLQTRFVSVDSARNSIQQEFLVVSAKADSLTQNNIQLHGDLADKSSAIQKMKSDIGNILKKKNATQAELAQAKQMIADLNGKVDGLFAEVEKLTGENKTLTADKEQLTTEKTQLTAAKQDLEQNLSATTTQKKQLEEKVDVASTLHASAIGIAAIKVRNGGKEKETTTAKRADLIRISFNLDENRVTPTGTKDIYVIVTSPEGQVISDNGSAFTTRDEGSKSFTSKVSVNYEQGKIIPVSFDWKQTDRFKEGDYKIEIYNNGFKIGQGVKTLKKGGLFS